VVATGVATDGHREVLGFEVGDNGDGAFCTAFLRSLKARDLAGVHNLPSPPDSRVLSGTRWLNREAALPDPDIVDQHVDREPHTVGRVSSYPADRKVQDHAHRDP
jgi:hypothetical protein